MKCHSWSHKPYRGAPDLALGCTVQDGSAGDVSGKVVACLDGFNVVNPIIYPILS